MASRNNRGEYDVKLNFHRMHLARRNGTRGRKVRRLSMKEDLQRLGRALHVPVYFNR